MTAFYLTSYAFIINLSNHDCACQPEVSVCTREPIIIRECNSFLQMLEFEFGEWQLANH